MFMAQARPSFIFDPERLSSPSSSSIAVPGNSGKPQNRRPTTFWAHPDEAGDELIFANRAYKCEVVEENSFDNVDIALFSAGGEFSKEWAPKAKRADALLCKVWEAIGLTNIIQVWSSSVKVEEVLS